MNAQAKLEVAVETTINDFLVNGGSSRLTADKVVKLCKDVLVKGKKVKKKQMKPWAAFAPRGGWPEQ
ncbi:MAG: hypothetical protein EPN91_08180 [Salinibacterium sp.]|nr:MAG: hypothetical protein EPN91_08180 [Salinibacterium sp.]